MRKILLIIPSVIILALVLSGGCRKKKYIPVGYRTGTPAQAANPNPADGSTDIALNQTLGWDEAKGADTYRVYFGTSSPGAVQGGQTELTFDPGALTEGTRYFWRIDTINDYGITFGRVWTFTTVPPIPDAPAIPTPADSAVNIALGAALDWEDIPYADGYYVFFGTVPDPPYYSTEAVSDCNPPALAWYTTYYWKVIAYNFSGNSSSTVWSFRTIIEAPADITGITPASGSTAQPTATIMNWADSARAVGYHVWFGDVDPPDYIGQVLISEYDNGTLAYGTTYYWKLKAYNAGGNSSEAGGSFRTKVIFTITATAGAGGTINPSGSIPVIEGDNQSFTMTPDIGYHVKDVLVDGLSVGPVTNYEFVNVTADDTISAIFTNTTWADVSPGGTEGVDFPTAR
ncbi:MAG: hypothetical protein E3J72_11175 [Planctomycetota bacterium]|nr:MAG: hypothetical protein E3J72_11175 [Planctomycetota bacterium]